jgi:hypothetical protein
MRSGAFLQSEARNDEFLKKYAPMVVKSAVVANELTAVEAVQSNPQLKQVAAVYGRGMVEKWLCVQLMHTFGMCGFECQLGYEATAEGVAKTIASEYDYLRIGELALFLSDFEHGRLGELYQRFQLPKFLGALSRWLTKRAELISRAEQVERERRRAESAARAVPPPTDLPTLNAIMARVASNFSAFEKATDKVVRQ